MALTEGPTRLLIPHLRDSIPSKLISIQDIANTQNPIIPEKISYTEEASTLKLIAENNPSKQLKDALFSNATIRQFPELFGRLKSEMKSSVDCFTFFLQSHA